MRIELTNKGFADLCNELKTKELCGSERDLGQLLSASNARGRQAESLSFTYKGKKGQIRRRSARWAVRYHLNGKEVHRTTMATDKQEAIEILRRELSVAHAAETNQAVGELSLGPADLALTNTPSNIGMLAELMVCMDLINRGVPVFRAMAPNSPCDLVAIIGGEAKMIEVKVGFINGKGNPKVATMRPTCRFDILALVNRAHGIKYVPELPALPGQGR